MIKVFKGSASAVEILAIEKALRALEVEANQDNEYGRPILRSPIEIDVNPRS